MTRLASGRRHRWRLIALLGLAVLYYAIPNARPDFTRFNCHDSESYLALSYSLTHGLGYTRSLAPERYIAHEMWPPGMPVLLTPATVGGEGVLDWTRVKLTMATLGVLGLIPIWLWLRRVGGEGNADVGAITLALNPFYWHFSHQAMAELPLLLWLAAGLWWIDRSWSRERVTPSSAILGGLICGLGLLIKGHAAGLALAPLAYLGAGGSGQTRRSRFSLWLVFCLAFALPFSAWLARNATIEAPGPDGYSQLQQVRMADPMDPSSEERGTVASIGSMLGNLRHHAIYHLPAQIVPGLWPPAVLAWPGSGWLALALTLLLIAAAWDRRRTVRAALLVVAFLSSLNLLYGYGGSPRFWVPVSLLLLPLIAARIARSLTGLSPWTRRALAVAAGLALVVNLASYVSTNERQPYNPEGPWSELARLFETVGASALETAGVLTPNPHAFQLTTGLPAPMVVAESTFEHMVARTDDLGPQPPAGSTLVLEVAPWALYELAAPTSGADLTGGPPRYPMNW